MSLADDLTKLEELRRTGSLTEKEFAQAKAKLLAGDVPPAPDAVVEKLGEQLAETRYQNELARIDREWQIEREKYMLTGKYGRRFIPTVALGGFIAVGGGLFGVFWALVAFGITSAMPDRDGFAGAKVFFPLIGVLIPIGAVAYGVYVINKANEYSRALAAYQKRRAAIKAEDFR